MHDWENLLNDISNVWPGEGEVLESPSETVVLGGIANRRTIRG